MSDLSLMNHPNLVVVHFNPYAGGKFWINCVSHSPWALPGLSVASPKYTTDLWLLDDLDADEIQRRKIARIHSTLPERSQMYNWCQSELGCNQFWGDTLRNLLFENKNIIQDTAIQLLDRYRCFIVNHQADDVACKKIFNLFPRAQHILLSNADNFQQNSMAIKQSDPWPLKYDIPTNLDAFVVDVDNTYMNVDLTIARVKDCLQYLGLSTELDSNIHSFVTRYFELHH
jgi:hypothetical protein